LRESREVTRAVCQGLPIDAAALSWAEAVDCQISICVPRSSSRKLLRCAIRARTSLWIAPMLSQLTMSAVSSVETKTHRMILVDTLFSGACRRLLGSTSWLFCAVRGGFIGPQAKGLACSIDHLRARLDALGVVKSS